MSDGMTPEQQARAIDSQRLAVGLAHAAVTRDKDRMEFILSAWNEDATLALLGLLTVAMERTMRREDIAAALEAMALRMASR